MISAELRGKIRVAMQFEAALTTKRQSASEALAGRLGDNWMVNLSNDTAAKRTIARLNTLPGMIECCLIRSGGIRAVMMTVLDHEGVGNDAKLVVKTGLLMSSRRILYTNRLLLETKLSKHAHARMLVRTQSCWMETHAVIHVHLTTLLAEHRKDQANLDGPLDLIGGIFRVPCPDGGLGIVDLDPVGRQATVVTYIDRDQLGPEQEELVARFKKGKTTLECLRDPSKVG